MKYIKIAIILVLSLFFLSLSGQLQYELNTLNPGPVETFADNCASCHGPNGSFYGEKFGSREDEELKKFVEEMMRGPAFLKPSEADIKAMTAYHRALSAGEPFICVTDYDSTSHVARGEVVFQNTFYMKQKNGDTAAIAVDSSGLWKTKIKNPGQLMATNDSTKTSLDIKHHQWSHRHDE